MCVNRPSVRIVLVTLLFAVALSTKQRFEYSKILDDYRYVIIPELQSKNLTGSSSMPESKNCCPSDKVQAIFRSICGMTKQYLNNTTQQGEMGLVVEKKDSKQYNATQQGEMELVVKMNTVISERCKELGKVKEQRNAKCKGSRIERCQKRRKKRRDHCRREEKAKLVQMLVFCWQKLQSATPQGRGRTRD